MKRFKTNYRGLKPRYKGLKGLINLMKAEEKHCNQQEYPAQLSSLARNVHIIVTYVHVTIY